MIVRVSSSPVRLILIICLISVLVFSAASAFGKKRLRPGLGLGRGLIRASLTPYTNHNNRRESRMESRQGAGLVASAIAYGLASLPFVVFPLLFMAPYTYAKITPILQNVNDALDEIKEPPAAVAAASNPIQEILSAAGISNDTSNTVTKFAEALGINPMSLSHDSNKPSASQSASSALANALGDAIFSPGLFNPASNYIGSGKYKPYIFSKNGPLPVEKPLISEKIEKLQTPILSSSPSGSSSSLSSKPHSTYNPFDDLKTKAKNAVKTRNAPSTGENLALVAKDVMKTVVEGVRKYEMEKSECRERLVCEVSQKYAGASFKSWATALMDVLELDSKIEAKVAKKNFLLRNVYRGARSSLSDKTCADLFPNCP